MMFVIFDSVTGDPFIVKVSDRDETTGKIVSVICNRALTLCNTKEKAVKMLRKIFGKDDKWNTSRFTILPAPEGESASDALQKLIDFTGATAFYCDDGKIRDKDIAIKDFLHK